jgi:hypothetical protein
MHPEGVPLFLAVNECDPFRVGDGAEKDANNG